MTAAPRLRDLCRAASVVLAGAVLVLLGAGTALADNGPHVQGVGGSTGAGVIATSDGCAGCHRTHTGQGASLLVATGSELCLACHGPALTGATTNVIDGVKAASTTGLLGGGFVNARMNTSWTAIPASRSTSSAHTYDGSPATMWGAGEIGSGPGIGGFALNCTSCHDPHGNGQYRILRPIPTGAPSSTPITITDPVAKVYTVSSPLNRYFGQMYNDGVYADQLNLDRWCSACHSRYDAGGTNPARTSSGDPTFTYRHATRKVSSSASTCASCHPQGNGDPVNILGITSATAHVPVCENCHVAHGSAAVMGDVSAAVPYPDGTTRPAGSTSALLRLDNRGVCRACHGR